MASRVSAWTPPSPQQVEALQRQVVDRHQRTHGRSSRPSSCELPGEAHDEPEEPRARARRHVDRRGRADRTARRPYVRTAGSGSGVAMPGVSHPALPQDEPAATPSRSRTVTSTPCSWRNQAVDRPTMPAPTTATRWGAGRPAAVRGAIRRGWTADRVCRLVPHTMNPKPQLVLTTQAPHVLAHAWPSPTSWAPSGVCWSWGPSAGAEVDDSHHRRTRAGHRRPARRPRARRRGGDRRGGLRPHRAQRGRRCGGHRAAPRAGPSAHRPGPREAQRHRPRGSSAEQASWAHLVWLLRGVLDRAAVGPAPPRRRPCPGRPVRARGCRGCAGRRSRDDRGRPVAGPGLLLAPGPHRPRPSVHDRGPSGAGRGARDVPGAGRVPAVGALLRTGVLSRGARHQGTPGHPRPGRR